ncbi:hypothetical protein RRG08_033300 [Elysia crispata]|uniref:Uncharacterized protein n=1 Tax=Elysia crispata TaxID=231223 RepID=A0AAE0XS27_9GAST|nr:hypothetical protein RRG08_033300 [Elysia crispata]
MKVCYNLYSNAKLANCVKTVYSSPYFNVIPRSPARNQTGTVWVPGSTDYLPSCHWSGAGLGTLDLDGPQLDIIMLCPGVPFVLLIYEEIVLLVQVYGEIVLLVQVYGEIVLLVQVYGEIVQSLRICYTTVALFTALTNLRLVSVAGGLNLPG